MAKFNPGSSPGGDYSPLPAGTYLLGLVRYERRVAKSGKQYGNQKWAVIAGDQKGKSFFAMQSFDMTKRGNQVRFNVWAECVGQTEEFEIPDPNGSETANARADEDYKRVFLGRGVKAIVKLEENGGYKNNSIVSMVYRKLWTPDDERLIKEWEQSWRERKGDFAPPDDDYGPPEDSYGDSEDSYGDSDGGFDQDKYPF